MLLSGDTCQGQGETRRACVNPIPFGSVGGRKGRALHMGRPTSADE